MLFFDMTKLGTIDLSSTSAEKGFLATLQCEKRIFHLSKDLNFRHTSKKFKGGSPKKILEKKNVFPKKYVELMTFDGILWIVWWVYFTIVQYSECTLVRSQKLTLR